MKFLLSLFVAAATVAAGADLGVQVKSDTVPSADKNLGQVTAIHNGPEYEYEYEDSPQIDTDIDESGGTRRALLRKRDANSEESSAFGRSLGWFKVGKAAAEAAKACAANEDCDTSCFPGDGLVELEDGKLLELSKVKVGDRVRSSSGKFSDVYMFSHVERETQAQFLLIETESGARIKMTTDHLLSVDNSLVPAGKARVGQSVILANGTASLIKSIGTEYGTGIYAPQTLAGTVVVNGVEASCFTSFSSPESQKLMLFPMRVLYSAHGGAWWFGANEDSGIPTWLRSLALSLRGYV